MKDEVCVYCASVGVWVCGEGGGGRREKERKKGIMTVKDSVMRVCVWGGGRETDLGSHERDETTPRLSGSDLHMRSM